MKSSLATLALVLLLSCARPADAASQYESIDYYVQQMIVHGDAGDATGVQTFREQMENLRRPEPGDPAKARPFQQQGLEHLARGNAKDGLAAFRQAFIADPADPEIAGQLGQTYLRLHRFKEAERLAVYTLSLAPAQSAAWLVLGEVYGQTGDATRAGGAFANAYRFAKEPAPIVEQLRRLAATGDADALKAGAQKALRLGEPAASPKPAPPATPAPPPPTASAAPATGPNPAPEPAAPARADAPPTAKAADAGSVLGSLRRGLERLANRPDGPNPAGSTPPPAPDATNPGQQIYRRSVALTCLIVTFRNGKTDNLGSGLLVSADGLVLTNNHVIDKADNLAVRCGERESTAQVRKRSKEPDLALLATSLAGGEAFALNESYSQDLIGRDVFVIGNPYGLEGTFSTGVISGLREIGGVRHIQISAPVSPGNSGGPVILRDGSVIGITAMGLKVGQNLNFAIASAEVIASDLFDPARMKRRSPGRD